MGTAQKLCRGRGQQDRSKPYRPKLLGGGGRQNVKAEKPHTWGTSHGAPHHPTSVGPRRNEAPNKTPAEHNPGGRGTVRWATGTAGRGPGGAWPVSRSPLATLWGRGGRFGILTGGGTGQRVAAARGVAGRGRVCVCPGPRRGVLPRQQQGCGSVNGGLGRLAASLLNEFSSFRPKNYRGGLRTANRKSTWWFLLFSFLSKKWCV